MSDEEENEPGAAATEQASQEVPEAEALIRRVASLVDSARPMPLSASVMVNREEILELLDEALAGLPDEMRAARWLLKEREEFLAKTRRDADEIITDAKNRVAQMVQRQEVVKAAEARAREIVEQAQASARRMRHEVEDYCDQRLASFEIVLERTLKTVQGGRERLSATGTADEPNEEGLDDEPAEGAVFDQDTD
ncbi:MAG: hypothetical protein JJLCMIEE_02285 [Acidimicrobiales bacterium]|nr:MAG: hypothetical protein EDR02_08630 [Actinomycetota bacterium]MBV6509217.1 hypothetical protein [Acidimicrobiales bacterium]RIK08442.1 MAG: hypothetical protein DCC48_00375 [Acidobacteriota bacterium]